MPNPHLTTKPLTFASEQPTRALPHGVLFNTVVLLISMCAFLVLANVRHLAGYVAIPAFLITGGLALLMFYRNLALLQAEASDMIDLEFDEL